MGWQKMLLRSRQPSDGEDIERKAVILEANEVASKRRQRLTRPARLGEMVDDISSDRRRIPV